MEAFNHQSALLIPILGILAGIIITISVFIWLYFDEKGKENSPRNCQTPRRPYKLEELLKIFDERKKEPIDYRRGGLITTFVGLGIVILGYFSFGGTFFMGAGCLVSLIGLGTFIAGYLYTNTGAELTQAVEEFEKK